MKNTLYWLFTQPVTGTSSILVIRFMAATLFFWQGANQHSILSITAEIIGSILLLLGLMTRLTSLLLIILTFLLTTPLAIAYSQFLGCLFLLLEGPGRRSLDFFIATSGKIYHLH
jgi:putative oxidoreductase